MIGKPRIVPKNLYRHYGVDAHDGTVIHFTGQKSLFSGNQAIRRTTMGDFLDGGDREFDEMVDYAYTREETLLRALSKLGSDFSGYNFLTNNCEHFAHWCATGKRSSRQVGFLNDDKDIVEKGIDNFFEPLVLLGGIIDDFFGW